ncbi:glutamate 5-kinase [Bradyrhizobium sp. LM6.10]
MASPELSQFRRIVVKVGSALLVDSDRGEVRASWLAALADDMAKLHGEGRDVLVVSSGSIALGRSRLKLPRGPLKLEESQAAAAVGQIALARIWSEVLGAHGIGAGQILVTLQDTEERRRYLNARSTIGKLLEWRAIPVINENDTVATNEIRYGDNDRLAARVATMASADLLVLLSDIDGLYDAPPKNNPNAKLIPVVDSISSEIEAVAGDAESELSRGGMRTKVEAAKIATTGGTHMLIASGKDRASLAGNRRWRPLHLVPDARQSHHFAKTLDRGLAGAEGHADHRRRRSRRATCRRQPAAGRRDQGRGPVRPRRRRDRPWPRHQRGRPRPDRLRCRRRRADQGPLFPGRDGDPRHQRAVRDDPPRRSGDGRVDRQASTFLQAPAEAWMAGKPGHNAGARPLTELSSGT